MEQGDLRRTLILVAVLNLLYFGVEFTAALSIGSVSLLADSADFLEDAAVNLLSIYHDRIVARANGKGAFDGATPESRYAVFQTSRSAAYRTAALALAVLQASELLAEIAAKHRFGDRTRWHLVLLIELAKCGDGATRPRAHSRSTHTHTHTSTSATARDSPAVMRTGLPASERARRRAWRRRQTSLPLALVAAQRRTVCGTEPAARVNTVQHRHGGARKPGGTADATQTDGRRRGRCAGRPGPLCASALLIPCGRHTGRACARETTRAWPIPCRRTRGTGRGHAGRNRAWLRSPEAARLRTLWLVKPPRSATAQPACTRG